jgi:Calcineurin-like phosphoesterase
VKKAVVSGALVALIALVVSVVALGGSGSSGGKAKTAETIAVYGDSPYGTTNADTAQFNATLDFIDAINSDPDVSLVMHIGDIHSGKQFCTQAYDQAIYQKWQTFTDPLVYTPGDNEWSDCHKTAEGGGLWNTPTAGIINFQYDSPGVLSDFAAGNPVANLLLVRSIFFPSPGITLGQTPLTVDSQALDYDPSHPSDRYYVENVMWEQSNVLFVTVNLPGGSNNDDDIWYGTPTRSSDQQQEALQRTGADLRWLDAAFARAKRDKLAGVVIGAQADMWDPEKGAAHQALYEPFVQKIADSTKDFGNPVIMFNGDSHVYRSDNPLSPTAGCVWEGVGPCISDYSIHSGGNYDVPNFHRVVVHGSTAPMEWLKVKIDPLANYPNGNNAFGPLSWARQNTGLG